MCIYITSGFQSFYGTRSFEVISSNSVENDGQNQSRDDEPVVNNGHCHHGAQCIQTNLRVQWKLTMISHTNCYMVIYHTQIGSNKTVGSVSSIVPVSLLKWLTIRPII